MIAELVLRVESCWLKIDTQIQFLQSIWGVLGQELQMHQSQILDVLQGKLVLSERKLERVIPLENEEAGLGVRVKLKRFKFSFALKSCLEKTINDLESWRDRFDPSWWLILRLKDPVIDQHLVVESSEKGALTVLKALRNEISAQENEVKQLAFAFVKQSALTPERENIEGSLSTIACIGDTQHYVIVDTITCDSAMDPELTKKDIQDLTRVLARVEPSSFSLLTCFGAVRHRNPGQDHPFAYDLLFNVPSNTVSPQSLRKFLETSSSVSLNERIQLAVGLAKAVLYLHASHFVHKNIRPENILIFSDSDEQLGKPYLVGFEKFRLDTTSTRRYGDDLWEKNIYRHPQRQGVRPQEDFIMQHDVYSLGIVLLELGMGISFLDWHKEGTINDRPIPNTELEITDLITAKKKHGQGIAVKKKMISLAEAELPCTFGRKYTEVVLSCLTCLDERNTRFGDLRDLQDDNGVLVGMRFVKKACRPSHEYQETVMLIFKDPLITGRHLCMKI